MESCFLLPPGFMYPMPLVVLFIQYLDSSWGIRMYFHLLSLKPSCPPALLSSGCLLARRTAPGTLALPSVSPEFPVAHTPSGMVQGMSLEGKCSGQAGIGECELRKHSLICARVRARAVLLLCPSAMMPALCIHSLAVS